MTRLPIALLTMSCVTSPPVAAAPYVGTPMLPTTHEIAVLENGTFWPEVTTVRRGDTVRWLLAEDTDAVVPVSSDSLCNSALPFTADGSNLTGPMPVAAGGVWIRGPHELGTEVVDVGDPSPPCSAALSPYAAGDQYLCNTGKANKTMAASWANPYAAGVFVQLPWKALHHGPGDFDFDRLTAELNQAVAHGKLVTLSVKAGASGTPAWIFDEVASGYRRVKPLEFQDRGSEPVPGCDGGDCCGTEMTLGSPADENYREHYFDMWRAVGAHVRSNSAWFRAVAGVKPSGMNLLTHENRLPHRCLPGCDICNSEVWALDGGYTPAALLGFYKAQFEVLATQFPGKDIIFMLIQGGWPRVGGSGPGEYETVDGVPPGAPGSVPQMKAILKHGTETYGEQFVMQHNGLGVSPVFLGKAPCPQHGMPEVPPAKFGGNNSACPNRFVVKSYYEGYVTGLQTNNGNKIADGETLQSALENAWKSSGAIFVEIYESLAWMYKDGSPLSVHSGDTLASWAEAFEGRRDAYHDPVSLHEWTVPLTSLSPIAAPPGKGPVTPEQVVTFVHPAKCADGYAPSFGKLVVLP